MKTEKGERFVRVEMTEAEYLGYLRYLRKTRRKAVKAVQREIQKYAEELKKQREWDALSHEEKVREVLRMMEDKPDTAPKV